MMKFNPRRAALAFCWIAGLSCSCSQPRRARVGEDIQMPPFTLRVVSVEGYSRAHQGVPWEVAIRVTCSGGNRFDRLDFAETVSRRGPIYFATAQGWHERAWLLGRGDDFREFVIHVNPPPDSTGMTLAFADPRPAAVNRGRVVVDLGH